MVRVGDTVRRPWQPWSGATASLLQHLEAAAFSGAPRWRGRDELGREVLSFVKGDVPTYPLDVAYWGDASLLSAARLLRSFHDATAAIDWTALPWRFQYSGSGVIDVICHNDIAPYNTVYEEGVPKAFIDFDTAGPGPRVWDVCYAAYRFVPLIPSDDYKRNGVPANLDVARRVTEFCRAYGEFSGDLVAELQMRLDVLARHIETEAKRGVPWHVDNLAKGHVELYDRHAQWIENQKHWIVSHTRR